VKSFKSVHVVGTTLDDTWFQLLSELYKHGRVNRIDSGSYEKETTRLEFDYVSGTILYPTNRPLSPRLEGLAVPPPTDEESIEKYFANYIMNGMLERNEHYKYATWIVGGNYKLPRSSAFVEDLSMQGNIQYKNIHDITMKVPDQLTWIIKHFKEKGYANNHCYIQVGYPESAAAYDVPYTDETERQTSPCLRGIDFKIVEENDEINYLLTNVYFRSWDLWGGWPENMGGIIRLAETICEMLGDVEVGPLSFTSKGLHAYGFQLEAVKTRLNIHETD
jgi:thymidylate synthase